MDASSRSIFDVKEILQMYGSSPLHKAAELGHSDSLTALLRNGYSANETNYDCLTPLHAACIHNQVHCAEILIENGAKVNAFSIDGGTPLCDACAIGSVSCVQLLLKNGAEVNPPLVLTTPLHEACLRGSVECAAILITAGARLNVNDCHFGTPLHSATFMNHPECVRLLLQAGAKVNAIKIHQTALHVAAVHDFFEVGKILLEYGADIYASNNQNKLPIELLPEAKGPFYGILSEYAVNPRSLQEWCRRSVRSKIKPSKLTSLQNMELPKPILSFLLHRM